MRISHRTLCAIVLALSAFVATGRALAAETGRILGTVKSQEGAAADGAAVTLVQLSRHATADAAGAFQFDAVPPGRYLIEVVSPRYGSAVGQVLVKEGEDATLALSIDLTIHHEDIVVSAGVSPQSVADVSQSVVVLDERELAQKIAPTLGETLSQEPGVQQTQYAPGASRPIIRGLGGDRIRILQDGIGAGDASNVSTDHAVSIDPYNADRIEVVRGAATLLYGSNAVGGVVNVLDHRIPDHRTDRAVTGDVNLRYGTVNEIKSGAVDVGGTAGAFGWNLDYSKAKSNDVKVGSDSVFADDTIPNSDLESQNWSVGASWLGEKAFVGAAYDQFETNYGSAVESAVRIDMHQKRWDVRGGINEPFGPFRVLKARLGGTDYDHVELEDGAVGTQFLNKSYEGRLELAHKQAGAWNGSFGIQSWHRDFEAIGDEAFVQPTTTFAQALFAFEEVGTGSLKGQFGLRYEHQSVDSDDATLRDRSFGAPSASAGLLWNNGAYAIASTLSYSSRVPTAEELYANGPHIATFSFEVGDDDLDLEKSVGLDVALRKVSGRIEGDVNLFATRFTDYIFERDTGTTFTTGDGDVLPVIQFTPGTAQFYGAEAHVDFGLVHADPHHLDLELRADYVHAELTDLNEPVPLQPPLRGSLGLKYQGRALWASLEGAWADKQDRFAAFDTETPGYTWVNAAIGYRLIAGRTVHDFILRGVNLTDKLAFNSVSRFRDAVPLPGRDVSLNYRLAF
jgi:iron complex outermembrane receptor protein